MVRVLKKVSMSWVFLAGLFMAPLQGIWAQSFPTAKEIAGEMTIGWNIGNTLEAVYNDGSGGETYWGNPLITQRLIDSVKAAGFNTVRLPIAWEAHAVNGTINSAWLARIKEVVDYCYNRELYTIINIHWDNGWLEENCTPAMQAINNQKQANYWSQIASYFKNYGEKLLFASANEPHVADATQMAVLLSYHQTFINTVRATGGNNALRTLIIQGPATDIEKTNNLMNTMPTDPASDRLMAEVHFYPYQFSLMERDESWGNQFYYWGACNRSSSDPAHNPTWGEEAWVDEMFRLMKIKFVDKGYPVLLGEFGVKKRTNLSGNAYELNVRSREYYLKYVVKSSIRHGLIPIYWCAGLGELFDRNTGKILEPGTVHALMAGSYTVSDMVNCGESDCKRAVYGHAYVNKCDNCVLGYDASCYNVNPADCSGEAGGLAYLDNCGVCVGGNTGLDECIGSLEAEEACDVDGILLEDRNGGFSGAGYVNTTNALGSYATWFLESDQPRTATLTFRYANSGTVSRDGRIMLNGVDSGLLPLPSTGSWSDWRLSTVLLALKSGVNELTLVSATDEGLANLDILYFSEGVSSAGCTITGMSGTVSDQNISVYPNPTTGNVRWEVDKKWVLLSTQGKILNQGLGNSADLSEYPSGLYMLKLDDHFIQIIRK